jgi:predicted transcriptional regulator with HTH domain
MSDEFDHVTKEVEEALYELIELGLVEAYGVDENGAFIYNLTDKGREMDEKLETYDMQD